MGALQCAGVEKSNTRKFHGDRYDPTDALPSYLCCRTRGFCADCRSSNQLEQHYNDQAAGNQRGHIHTAVIERRIANGY
jgi:hypothetical protein